MNKHLIFNLSAITQRILVNVLTAAEGVKSTGNWQQKALRRRPKINLKKGKYWYNNKNTSTFSKLASLEAYRHPQTHTHTHTYWGCMYTTAQRQHNEGSLHAKTRQEDNKAGQLNKWEIAFKTITTKTKPKQQKKHTHK